MAIKAGKETIEIATLNDSTIRYFTPFQAQCPDSWWELHNTDYGKNPMTGEPLRQQTFPEAVRMFNFAQAHKRNPIYEPIIRAVNDTVLTGNTLLLQTFKGFYGVDFPSEELVAQLYVDDQSALSRIENKLQDRLSGGRRIGEHVRLSRDGFVRHTPSQKVIHEEQDRDVLATNPGVIVIAGNLQNSRGLARSSRQYPMQPLFYNMQDIRRATVQIPALYGDRGSRLSINGGWSTYCHSRCSFGGSDIRPRPSAA